MESTRDASAEPEAPRHDPYERAVFGCFFVCGLFASGLLGTCFYWLTKS